MLARTTVATFLFMTFYVTITFVNKFIIIIAIIKTIMTVAKKSPSCDGPFCLIQFVNRVSGIQP